MRVVYFGTSQFAVPALHKLLESRHEVVGVVTQPDRPHGRRNSESCSPVKRALLDIAPDLKLLQPEKARTKEFRLAITGLRPDVMVVAAFGQILSQRLLDVPKFGGINIHGSLLPRWRGAAPMQYSMIAGDKETGVTIMQMSAGLDSGDILLQEAIPLTADDNVDTVEARLSVVGADLLMTALERIEDGALRPVVQDETLVTYAPPLPPDFGFINWKKPASEISNLVQGVTPKPGAFALIGGKRIKIWRCQPDQNRGEGEPGTIVELRNSADLGILIQSGDCSRLLVKEVQPESKGRMRSIDYARGARLTAGSKFDINDRTDETGS
jgi:methionyl-tRNA formyltransferase